MKYLLFPSSGRIGDLQLNPPLDRSFPGLFNLIEGAHIVVFSWFVMGLKPLQGKISSLPSL